MRKFIVVLFVSIVVLSSCSVKQDVCDSKMTYSNSYDSSLFHLKSSDDFLLLIVRDSTEKSSVIDSFFTQNLCWVDSLNNTFKSIVSHSLPSIIKKKTFDKVLVDFQKEHKLSLPFAVAIGQNDTVFTFISLKPKYSTKFNLDSVWTDLIFEIRNENLRNDYTFLHGSEKDKYLTPSYHSWTKEVVAFKFYDEKEHKLIIELRNPNKIRIIADGTNQRDYMTPLRIIFDEDSISSPSFKWITPAHVFYDDFLKKNYQAYTDSIIIAEAILGEEMFTNLNAYPIRISYSAYLPKRKVMLNSIQIPVNSKTSVVDSIQ